MLRLNDFAQAFHELLQTLGRDSLPLQHITELTNQKKLSSLLGLLPSQDVLSQVLDKLALAGVAVPPHFLQRSRLRQRNRSQLIRLSQVIFLYLYHFGEGEQACSRLQPRPRTVLEKVLAKFAPYRTDELTLLKERNEELLEEMRLTEEPRERQPLQQKQNLPLQLEEGRRRLQRKEQLIMELSQRLRIACQQLDEKQELLIQLSESKQALPCQSVLLPRLEELQIAEQLSQRSRGDKGDKGVGGISERTLRKLVDSALTIRSLRGQLRAALKVAAGCGRCHRLVRAE